MNALFSALSRAFRAKRRVRSLHVVDEVALFGGCAVHVVDVDSRRLVFATSPSSICLLAQFERGSPDASREEPVCGPV